MEPDRIAEQTKDLWIAIRAEAEVLAKEDMKQLGGARFPKAHRLVDLAENVLKPELDALFRLASLPAETWGTMPAPTVELIHQGALQPLTEAVEALRRFSSATADMAQLTSARSTASSQVSDAVRRASLILEPMLWRFDQRPDMDAELARVHALVEQLQDQPARVEETLTKANEALKVVQAAAIQKGVNEQGEAFGKAATTHRRAAIFWAVVAALIAGVILHFVSVSIETGGTPPLPKDPWWVAGNLAHFSARALGVSVLSFLLVVAVRNFRAERHNEIANTHRRGALATFAQFQTWASGPAGDAVVLQVSQAIFGSMPTGYRDREATAATHITELLKLVEKPGGDKT